MVLLKPVAALARLVTMVAVAMIMIMLARAAMVDCGWWMAVGG